jgi:Zn-finger nucleic acid-binding protein
LFDRIDPASQQICHSLQNAIRSGEMMKWLQDGGVQDQLMRSRSFNHQNFERELTQPSKKIEEAIKQIEAFSKKK